MAKVTAQHVMTRSSKDLVGNVLGAGRAEADSVMLAKAFVETADYRALMYTRDFNCVVGRRGTGKSALFQKTAEYFGQHNQGNFLVASTPKEHETLALQTALQEVHADYRSGRAILRLAWKIDILLSIFEATRHYKLPRVSEHSYIQMYKEAHSLLATSAGAQRCTAILKAQSKQSPHDIPGKIASELRVNWLEDNVRAMLTATGHSGIILWDGLDEGWVPDEAATAILGGLAAAVADFADSKVGIHGVLFIRDNMFRALAHFDRDFSRHIEGTTLRLNWDELSLLHLIANRLRAAFDDLRDVESDVKVWNRFADRGLQDRTGFELCLKHTLYRPRDLLVLLNSSYVLAVRQGRHEIIDDDIVSTSHRISSDRLDDLLKEYDTVFPGLGLFVRVFENQPALNQYHLVLELLDNAIKSERYGSQPAADFALFGSAQEAFVALYSVGFVGLKDASSDHYHFCHDGASANLLDMERDAIIAIHPCYWRALNATAEIGQDSIVIDADDELEQPGLNPESRERVAHFHDIRTRRLGQVLEELPRIALGHDGYSGFEDWVLRAFRILFAGKLSNIQFKPNAGNVQQRDIVATNLAQGGFWRRVFEDYATRQLTVEVKNFVEIGRDDFRQMLSYLGQSYGRFGLIVYRTESEGMTEKERTWLREIWHEHKRMVFTLPASMIRRSISKLRTVRKHDYAEATLSKRLDIFERSYVAIRQAK